VITNKKIGILMGGASSEREISLKSGNAVANALKALGYNTVAIDIKEDVCQTIKQAQIDIAFLVLHGGWGENGSIQGLLEIMGIPYTGCDVLSSAIAMDKEATKKIFLYHGIPIPEFKTLDKRTFEKELETVKFSLPWVIKPACEGSSVGINILKSKDALKPALDSAFSYGGKVIIEKYIKGKEVHIGILNDKALGGVEVKPSVEFYSYEAKYTAGMTEYILPPKIDGKTYKTTCDIALSAHQALGCRGATRVDTLIDDKGSVYVLEVNTIPGMTETSLLPKIAKSAGLDFPALIEEILREAIERNSNG
jgi:D-alanine-D-alanine ligase